jgi:hypothetical protein
MDTDKPQPNADAAVSPSWQENRQRAIAECEARILRFEQERRARRVVVAIVIAAVVVGLPLPVASSILAAVCLASML